MYACIHQISILSVSSYSGQFTNKKTKRHILKKNIKNRVKQLKIIKVKKAEAMPSSHQSHPEFHATLRPPYKLTE